MDYRTALFCEFDKYAAESYCAVHGVDPALNIGDITKADEKSVPAEYEADLPEIDATQVSYEDVIQSIYQQGGVADDNSIFKIKAYIDILPQEMTKIKKQASIAGILTVNGININDLIEDGLNRERVLEAAQNSIKSENEALIAETEADIENLKSLIEAAEGKIEEAKGRIAQSSEAIAAERDSIEQLLDFASGVAGKEGEQ